MAPQQNSTLIEDNLDGYPSLLNIPGEVNRYSPILAPKTSEHCNFDEIASIYKTSNIQDTNKFQMGDSQQAQQPQIYDMPNEKPCSDCLKHRQKSSRRSLRSKGLESCADSHNRHSRSRTISLYGVNSTVAQGNKEIPIWIGNEPRYVSGVTNKTTCNDIIKALIDDEISNGNNAYYKRSKDGAASRDYSDYVITECWGGIERSYEGNMTILPVWKAWSRVHNELRLSLKHKREVHNPIAHAESKNIFSSLKKSLLNLLKLSAKKPKQLSSTKEHKDKIKTKCLVPGKKEIPDEILFVILPDKRYNDGMQDLEQQQPKDRKLSARNLKPSSDELAKQAEAKLTKPKTQKLSSMRGLRNSMRQRRSRTSNKTPLDMRRSMNYDNNCIRKRKDMPLRNSVRQKLAQKTNEMNALFQREHTLTRELVKKCKLYRMQNALYTNAEKPLELPVEKLQRNIEEYGKEIIETEHELLALKYEIKEDISILNNLKRMTLEESEERASKENRAAPTKIRESTQVAKKSTPQHYSQMRFVDNIYEFCDNNASMLV